MAVSTYDRHWQLEDFLRAWEAGVFPHRVELVNGEVLAVSIGDWHGDTSQEISRALPNGRYQVSSASLAAGGSLPDPDCWVRPREAQPAGRLSRRLSRWASEDVLLVVEVSDETLTYDLTVKARLYAQAGFGHYWVVTPDGIHVHSEAGALGYGSCVVYRRGTQVPVHYAGVTLDVTALIGPQA